MRNIPIIGWLLLAALCLVGMFQAAHAQTVGTYTEQNGITKNAIGVVQVSGTVAQGGTATPADATSNTNVNASRDQSFNMVFNGTTWDRYPGDANSISVSYGKSSTFWTYTPPTGGLLNTTTAVTVLGAQGAGVRAYVTGGECMAEALGAATELVLLDGATPIFRMKIGTNGWNPVNFAFTTPLRGTANTALTMQTLTASVTGAVYCNWEGYTGV